MFTTAVVGLCLAFFVAFRIYEKSWAPPAILFLIGYVSATYLFANAVLKAPVTLPGFAYENFDLALHYTTTSLAGLLLGYVFYSATHGTMHQQRPQLSQLMLPNTALTCGIIVLVAALFLVVYEAQLGAFANVPGMGAYNVSDYVGPMYRLGFIASHMVGPLLIAVFISAYQFRGSLRGKVLRKVLLAFGIVLLLNALTMNRSMAASVLVYLLMFYHYRVRTLRPLHIAAALAVLVLLQVFRGLREFGVGISAFSSGEVLSIIASSLTFAQLAIILRGITMGIAGWDVFTNVIDLVPGVEGFKYGSTYAESFLGLFRPRVLGLGSYDAVTPSFWYMNLYAPGTLNHGFDFSLLAEAYINFGRYMPILFFFIGMLLAMLSRTITSSASSVKVFCSIVILVSLTLSLRSDSNVLLKSITYLTLPPLLVVVILNSFFRTVRPGFQSAPLGQASPSLP
jgi:hypothetical protein